MSQHLGNAPLLVTDNQWYSCMIWPSDNLIDQNVIVRTIWNGESHGITPKILDHPLCGHFVS